MAADDDDGSCVVVVDAANAPKPMKVEGVPPEPVLPIWLLERLDFTIGNTMVQQQSV